MHFLPAPITAATVLILPIFIATSAAAQSAAQQDLEAAVIIEAPETGVGLGWGWNTFQAEPVPTVCIEFIADESTAQTTTLDFQEVNDTFELMESMNVSAEVSVKTIGYEGSGQADFAKQVNVTGTSSTFLISAAVQNGARFAAPAPLRRGRDDASVAGASGIRLTRAATALARKDPDKFKDVCGNGFVSATMGGARLNTVVSIKTSTRSEKETVRTAVSGQGWGVKVEAAMGTDTESGTSSFSREISFYQAGGREQELPVDSTAILARVQALAKQAADAEKLFQIAVTPYAVLENWPRDDDLTGEEVEFDQLAALWGAYNSLYDELQQALDNPTANVVPVATCTGATCTTAFSRLSDDTATVAVVEDLQDEVLAALDTLEIAAETCIANEEGCEFDEATVRPAYAIRANMPVSPCLMLPPPDGNAACDPATATVDAGQIEDYTQLAIRDVAKSRCRFGSLTPGCINNATIRAWADRIGMQSRVVPTAANLAAVKSALPGTALKPASGGNSPDQVPGRFYFADPGIGTLPVVWFTAADKASVETAIVTALGG